ERSIEKVDLWKLDVEGYEIPALQGAEDWLKQKKIKAIYAELHGKNGQNIRDYLNGFGYQCYLFNKQKLYISPTLPKHTTGLFLPLSNDRVS
ncbi:MAG: FkbM family methyltransferase, partial [Pseudanabaena sp.]